MKITVETTVNATADEVWDCWTTPADIKAWNAASDDWHTTDATVDLRVGGAFCYRMEARDGSMGFDFAGEYLRLERPELIEFTLGERPVEARFVSGPDGVTVTETFEAEDSHTAEQQRQGWQASLDRFAQHVERNRQG